MNATPTYIISSTNINDATTPVESVQLNGNIEVVLGLSGVLNTNGGTGKFEVAPGFYADFGLNIGDLTDSDPLLKSYGSIDTGNLYIRNFGKLEVFAGKIESDFNTINNYNFAAIYGGTISTGIQGRIDSVTYISGGTISSSVSAAPVEALGDFLNLFPGTHGAVIISGGTIIGNTDQPAVRTNLLEGPVAYQVIISGGTFSRPGGGAVLEAPGFGSYTSDLRAIGLKAGVSVPGGTTSLITSSGSSVEGFLLNGDPIDVATSGTITVYAVDPHIFFSGTEGDWSKSRTWGLGVVPQPFHDVFINGSKHTGAPAFKSNSTNVVLSSLESVNSLTVDGGQTLTIDLGGIDGKVTGGSSSTITVSSGAAASLGDSADASGFATSGILNVGTGFLVLRDADAAEINGNTTISGGVLGATGLNTASTADGIRMGGSSGMSQAYGVIAADFTHDSTGDIVVPIGEVLNFSGNVHTMNTGGFSGAGTVVINGTLTPGNSPGTSDFSTLDVSLFGDLDIEIQGTTAGTDFDQVSLGTLSLSNADLNIAQHAGFEPTVGDSFQIVTLDGSSNMTSGTFNGLAEGDALSSNPFAIPLYITYQGGDGNDIVLTTLAVTPVPEPGSASLLLLGALYGVTRRGKGQAYIAA